MKQIIIALTLCLLTNLGFAADDPAPSAISTEVLIASLPKPLEYERLRQMTTKERQSDGNRELDERVKNAYANCKELQSRLVVGKSICDFPGILALGPIRWIGGKSHLYDIRVHSPTHRPEGAVYGGFCCMFDQSMNIVMVYPMIITM